MANRKISQLDEVTTMQAADALVIARSGANNRFKWSTLLSNIIRVTTFMGRTGPVVLQSSDLNGLDGSGLTGIGTGTGGVANTGSTTIAADTDEDGVGEIDFRTRNKSRAGVRNNGDFHVGGFSVRNLSGSAQTTTGTVTSGSHSLGVASAIDFAVGDGIFIAGAGTSGANLVTKIDAIVGTTLTLHDAASSSVSGVKVQHDHTALLLAEINDAIALRVRRIKCLGTFRFNAPLTGTGDPNANGSLVFPAYTEDEWAAIEIVGTYFPPVQYSSVFDGAVNFTSSFGTTFTSEISGGNMIGKSGGLDSLQIAFRNLIFRLTENPDRTALNLRGMQAAEVTDCRFDTHSTTGTEVETTHANGVALVTPAVGNLAYTVLRNIVIDGYFKAMEVNEHTLGDNITICWCHKGLEFQSASHPSSFGRVGAYGVTVPISAVGGAHAVSIQLLVIEHDGEPDDFQYTTNDIYDPDNYLQGEINYTVLSGGSFSKFGGRDVREIDLRAAGGSGNSYDDWLWSYYRSTRVFASQSDRFTANSIDSNRWDVGSMRNSLDTNILVAQSAGELEITTRASFGSATYGGLISHGTFNFAGVRMLAQAADWLSSSSNTFGFIAMGNNSSNHVLLGIENTGSGYVLEFVKKDGGVQTVVESVVLDARRMRFLSIREAGGTIFAEYSQDGVAWTLLDSTTVGWSYAASKVSIEAGSVASTPSFTFKTKNFYLLGD